MKMNIFETIRNLFSPKNYDRAISSGETCYKSQNYIEAIQYFEEALAVDPDSHHAYFMLGSSYSEIHKYEESIPFFMEAISKVSSKRPSYHLATAKAFQNLAKHEKAILHYGMSFRKTREDTEVYMNRSECHIVLQQFEKAIDDLTSAITINPVIPEFYLSRGRILQNLGQYDKARSDKQRLDRLQRYSTRMNAQFQIGDHVVHKRFGEGTVKERGPDGWIDIKFVSGEQRWMSESIAERSLDHIETLTQTPSNHNFENAISLGWEVLPPGWWTNPEIVSRIEASAGGEGQGKTLIERLTFLDTFNPLATYKSKFNSQGDQYYVFVFQNHVVAECPEYGNALYVLIGNTNWQTIFRKSRQEIRRTYGHRIRRIPHTFNWKRRLQRILR